jgi:hypothetical protein
MWWLAMAMGGVLLWMNAKVWRAERRAAVLRAEKATLTACLTAAQQQLDELAEYEAILDAETYVAEFLTAAAKKAEASQIAAQDTLADAREQAAAILHAAHLRAQTIAAEAHAASEMAREFEQTARAMKNVIDRFDDKYFAPVTGVHERLGGQTVSLDGASVEPLDHHASSMQSSRYTVGE